MNSNDIKKRYEKADDSKLLDLAANFLNLKEVALPILLKELEKREIKEEATKITEYLLTGEVEKAEKENALIIGDKMSGELYNIKQVLNNQGLDVYDLIAEEEKHIKTMEESIINLREQGASEDEIKQQLETKYGTNNKEFNELKSGLKSQGGWKKILGILIILYSFFLFVMKAERFRAFSLQAVILLFVGISMIYAGNKIVKKNQ